MFDGLLVNHAALEEAAQHLQITAREMAARLDALELDLAPLRGGWAGSAKVAYDGSKATWDAAMSELIEMLRQVGVVVRDSNAEYRSADLRGAARFE